MISIVIPIYNEEELICQLHEALAGSMSLVAEDWEVVYVNDGSKDSSLELLRELQSVDPRVVVVDLSRNWGHMGAISAGLRTARGQAVILMDGDMQDPPKFCRSLSMHGAVGLRLLSPSEGVARNGARFLQLCSHFSIAYWLRCLTIRFRSTPVFSV